MLAHGQNLHQKKKVMLQKLRWYIASIMQITMLCVCEKHDSLKSEEQNYRHVFLPAAHALFTELLATSSPQQNLVYHTWYLVPIRN